MLIGSVLALVLLCAVYAALQAALLGSLGKPRYVPVKALCSAAFVASAVVFSIYGTAPARLWGMLPGFVFCAAGDVLLGLYNLQRKTWQLLAGTLVFLAGHCLFFAAFCTRSAATGWDLALPAVASAAVLGLLFLPGMELHGMQLPCVVYAFVVALMCGKAFRLAFAAPTPTAWLTALGAGSVMLSDGIILFLYFYKPTKKARAVHIANLLTYYIGMFLLAAGLSG